jgi:hypothetical protein
MGRSLRDHRAGGFGEDTRAGIPLGHDEKGTTSDAKDQIGAACRASLHRLRLEPSEPAEEDGEPLQDV